MSNMPLYIGLNGFAGSGKDTVAKILFAMLNNKWESFEQFKEYYKSISSSTQFSTFNRSSENEKECICVAFADQLKHICASIFGIPVERFYLNKSNAWICINKDFQYTEIQPKDDNIITAEDFYIATNNYMNSSIRYYMSLREILVYVGTYMCQKSINKNIFINIVENNIKQKINRNSDIKYVIITDVRFLHELDYIRNKSGITITITRDDVKQLDNIAEHDLDYEEDYDFYIDNNGTYEDLFKQVWDMVNENIEFSNITVNLISRDGTPNYLRLVEDNEENNEQVYKLCKAYDVQMVCHYGAKINMIDPSGGPSIYVDSYIEGTGLFVTNIEFCPNRGYLIHTHGD